MEASEDLVRRLGLWPHPEGGYFRETYRAKDGASTAIFFLLKAGQRSRLHRIKSDELWHFYDGGPLVVAELAPDGRATETTLGRDLARGQRLQHVVPAGRWFGAYPAPGTDFALVGCTVAPAFRFEDLEFAGRAELRKEFPGALALIERLTDGR